ncbi:MAG: hypothetical protein ACLTUR_06570 [Paraclostridium sordellii]
MSKIHFEKLTPYKDVDLETYKEALDFIFENDEIKNIAITGSYSAGKSSVIESYKNINKNKKFLHISLANFKSDKKEDRDEIQANDETKYKESILEGKILNQLLHQIDPSKIPQTNFKVKRTESDKNIMKMVFMVTIFIISVLHILYYSKWSQFISSLSRFHALRFLLITTKDISLFFSGIVIITIFVIALFRLIKSQKNKIIFKKFKLNGNEIEIFENRDESYFDKYLNEVIYIFENCDADCIVFEDIDRYNMNEIFQRLREINTLVNSKRIVKKNEKQYNEMENSRIKLFHNFKRKIENLKSNTSIKEPLRFFYLIRDDIFIAKDRTKFFDFIMPIVPVIDSSNSYDQFIDHLEKGGVYEKFDEHFLQGISLYVDDMRILKNIYNEFMVYYNRIGTTEQDYNKLLAMIVYKNIFPRDFSDTQINIGFISTIFETKEDIIKEAINEIDNKIHEIKIKIDECKNEHLNNIDELGKVYTIYHYRGTTIDTQNPEYIKRKEILEIKENNKLSEIENELNLLNLRKMKVKNEKISNLITRENIDEVFDISYKNFLEETNDFNEIKSSQYFDLVKYLVRYGYIDESYEDYMTYFYGNSLTKNDKIFLRSVIDKRAKEWTYSLDKPKLVLSRLREIDFEEIETLNFELFNYLIEKEYSSEKYLVKFIEQLKQKSQFKFIEGYYSSVSNTTKYIKTMYKYWDSFIEDIYKCDEFNYEQKKQHILNVLYYFDESDILNINKNEFLTLAISSDEKFLNIQSPNVKKLIEQFIELDVKFSYIILEVSNEELFKEVYENKLYELNYKNISSMLRSIFEIQAEDDIKHKNYSLIIRKENSSLIEYVNENIQKYIQIVIENCDGEICDTEEAVLKLINNTDIDITQRKEYIKLTQTTITMLDEIKDKELWNLFLENEKIKYSLDNILEYYFSMDKKLDETIINFINSNIFNFEFSNEYINEKYGENSSNEILISIVECESIRKENYINMLVQFNFVYSKPIFGLENVSEERIKILIKLFKISVTSENIEFLRNKSNSLVEYLLELNIEEYIEKIDELPKLQQDEVMNLLLTSIEDKFKKVLISNYDGYISIIGINCSNDIKNFIIINKFDKSDLDYLVKNYNEFDTSIRNSIRSLCIEYVDNILSNKLKLTYELLTNIMAKGSIEDEVRLEILIYHAEYISKSQFRDAIEVTNLTEYKKIFNSGRPKIAINDVNREFLNKCIDKKYISDFYEEEGLFKIRRKGIRVNSVS